MNNQQDVLLRTGTLKCPKDNEPLHFEVMGMMRVKHSIGKNVWKYNARCPKCHSYYDVKAPKERV